MVFSSTHRNPQALTDPRYGLYGSLRGSSTCLGLPCKWTSLGCELFRSACSRQGGSMAKQQMLLLERTDDLHKALGFSTEKREDSFWIVKVHPCFKSWGCLRPRQQVRQGWVQVQSSQVQSSPVRLVRLWSKCSSVSGSTRPLSHGSVSSVGGGPVGPVDKLDIHHRRPQTSQSAPSSIGGSARITAQGRPGKLQQLSLGPPGLFLQAAARRYRAQAGVPRARMGA